MQADILSPLIGSRYRLEAQLGRGGMGAVYRAVDRLTGEAVALKRVTTPTHTLQFAPRITDDSDASGSSNLRLALAQEFHTLASLRHPNIIRVLDYGFDADGQPYLTMDLLDAPRTILEAGRDQPLAVKVGLIVQTLQALAYLHRRGVIHRDLKPDNVAVVREGGADHVRVLDFGLALAPESLQRDGAAYDFAGTLAYMAPEVLQGDDALEASDLYAVGVIAFELLTGVHPFRAETTTQMVNRVLNEPLDISPLLAVLPTPTLDEFIIVLTDEGRTPSLLEIIDRLLAKHPLDRYRSAEAVIADLCATLDLPIPEESAAIRESFLQSARFVGREAELHQLRAALDAAIGGAGSLWLIGGESGVGKSRLLQELRARAQIAGVLTLHGQAAATGGLPYHVWRDPVRRLILSTELTPNEASLLTLLVPDIAALADSPVRPLDAGRYRPQAAQQQLIQLIVDLFHRQTGPIVLLLEDLQWAHEGLEILRALAPFIPELPLLVVASFRDDERPGLPDELPQARLLSLQRLEADEIARLTASMLGDAGRRPDVVDFLQRETEGNAFFLVETVRALAEESGSLTSIGHATLPPRLITGGIQQVIERRLNRVPVWARDLLRLAAVIGRVLDMRLLAQAAETIDLEEWLTICANRAVFDSHEGVWRFAHDKLRETLLDGLSAAEWVAYHQQAALAIETAYAGDLERYAAALAEHWHNAGDLVKEGRYAISAAMQAEDASEYLAARRLFARALELRAYETADNPAQSHAEIHWRLGNTFYKMGDYETARAHQRQALALYRALDDRKGIANAITGIAEADMRQGLNDQAEAAFLEAQAIREEQGLTADIGYGYMNLGVIQTNRNNWEAARPLFEKCLAVMEQVGSERDIARALNNCANILDVLGSKDEARALHHRALAIRERVHDLHGICYSLSNIGWLEFDLENFAAARPLMEKALTLARRIADRNATASDLAALGEISFRQGDLTLAQTYLQEALDLRRAMEDRGGILTTTRQLGNTARAAGSFDAALAYYRDALALTEEFSLPWEIPQTLHEIARLLLAQDKPRQALKLLAFVRTQRDQPDHHDEDLINDLEARLTPHAYTSALTLGAQLTLADVRAQVAAGTLDF